MNKEQGRIQDFFRRGCTRLLLYFNTNKPHSFFLQKTRCIRKPQVISGGGGAPLHPPPRSAPEEDCSFSRKGQCSTKRSLRASKYMIKLLAVSRIVKWFEPSIWIVTLFKTVILSSAEDSLCCRGTGEKEKESARGTMGRGKKEERPLPYNYSFPYNVVYLKCMTTLGTRRFFSTGSFVSSAA